MLANMSGPKAISFLSSEVVPFAIPEPSLKTTFYEKVTLEPLTPLVPAPPQLLMMLKIQIEIKIYKYEILNFL